MPALFWHDDTEIPNLTPSARLMKLKNATTLQDIAREAGVSAMTVSVVLNGANSSTRVSQTTRTRVEKVAESLHYRPNGVARGLSRRRMDTLGVAAETDGNSVNLHFLEILNGILAACAVHGQNTTIFPVTNWQHDEKKLLQFCDGRVDGMLCISPMFSRSFAETLQNHTPFVTLHSDAALSLIPNLDVDNEGGAFAIVEYLIGQGHRRILHFAANPARSGGMLRLRGYRRALEAAGIVYDTSLVHVGEYTIDSGRLRMTTLLDRLGRDPLPTAIFCANDAIAYGCMIVLAERGIRVPEQISVVGFDDSLLALMTVPPLTTVRQPLRRMGGRAVEVLLQQIRLSLAPSPLITIPPPNIVNEVFDYEVLLRGSACPPLL